MDAIRGSVSAVITLSPGLGENLREGVISWPPKNFPKIHNILFKETGAAVLLNMENSVAAWLDSTAALLMCCGRRPLYLSDCVFHLFFTIFCLSFDILVFSSNFPYFDLKITSTQVKSNINSLNLRE